MKINKYYLFRNHTAELALFVNRILLAVIGIFIFTSILIIHLYHLQIIRFKDYRAKSNKNCIKLIPIIPNRGIIYDRQGIPLAINRTIYQLELIPEKINNLQNTITSLQSMLNLSNKDIINFKKILHSSHKLNSSMPLKIELNDLQQAKFAINQYRFPGVVMTEYLRRYYPYGSVLTNVIGYVSKINNVDITKLSKDGMLLHYSGINNIGKLGIERYYDNILHGKTGYEKVEVNNRGEIVRSLHVQPPQIGKDITLTLDLRLQQYIKKLLIGNKAAVVVVDPRDGGILALVSNPSYDPNLFVDGISNKDYSILLQDKNHPLINRVTQGVYPPASTVKPYILVSALTMGIINKNFSLFDPGWWQLPGSQKRFHDWKHWGHGYLNIYKALEESADTFFYQIAYNMGIDKLSKWMMEFGYGKYTGIDLNEERIGIMPNRNWKKSIIKKPWYQGDTISVGIGQGYWTATPIQMVKALMILINNGTVRIPHLLSKTKENNKITPYHQLQYMQIGNHNSGYWEIVKQGMYGVANLPNGTARKNFINASYKVAAKSGTAQLYSLKIHETYNVHKVEQKLRDHKLMTAFAPFNKPTIAVVVILENGGVGTTVGSITRHILDHVFLEKNK